MPGPSKVLLSVYGPLNWAGDRFRSNQMRYTASIFMPVGVPFHFQPSAMLVTTPNAFINATLVYFQLDAINACFVALGSPLRVRFSNWVRYIPNLRCLNGYVAHCRNS